MNTQEIQATISSVNPGMQLPSLSIVMPCLNEAGNVAAAIDNALKAIDKYGIRGELIVVNDGSTDETPAIVMELSRRDSRIRMIQHAMPQGIGASFLDGTRQATNELVVLFPGDNEDDPEDILRYFHLANDVDIIVPFICNVEVRSLARRVLSSLYRLIVNLSFGTNLNYTNGAVIYNRSVLNDLRLNSTGFFYQAEILIRLIRAGYLYAEVPHFLACRNHGKTKALTLRSFMAVAKSYLSLMWHIHVVRDLGATGAALETESATFRRRMSRPD
jgi:glycosyltransferase involved in cell wall biosynthesis